MAANVNPVFVKKHYFKNGIIDTANTGRDGSGTMTALVTGTTNGTRINWARVKSEVTTSAGMVRLFLELAASGDIWLFDEYLVSAITPSATVASYVYTQVYDDLVLYDGDVLYFSTEKAESMAVTVKCSDY